MELLFWGTLGPKILTHLYTQLILTNTFILYMIYNSQTTVIIVSNAVKLLIMFRPLNYL